MKSVNEIELKPVRKKKGLHPFLLFFVVGMLITITAFLIWFFIRLNMKDDFNRPWWQWLIFIAVIALIIITISNGNKKWNLNLKEKLKWSGWKNPWIAIVLVIITVAIIGGVRISRRSEGVGIPLETSVVYSPKKSQRTYAVMAPEFYELEFGKWNKVKANVPYKYQRGIKQGISCFTKKKYFGHLTGHLEKVGDPNVYWDFKFDDHGNVTITKISGANSDGKVPFSGVDFSLTFNMDADVYLY